MSLGFFAQITDEAVNMVTAHGGPFVSAGIGMFKWISSALIVWEGFLIAFRAQPTSRLAGLMVTMCITYTALEFYSAPFPIVGRNLTQIITDAGTDMANQMDTATEEQVGRMISGMTGDAGASSWNVVENAMANVRYFIVVFALSGMQIVMLAILAYGFVALGVLILVGPVFIPFLMVPNMEWLAMNWFKCLIQYAFYPVIGNAFILVYGKVWLNAFGDMNGDWTVTHVAEQLTVILIFAAGGIFGILKVPRLVSEIFSGSSGTSAMPAIGWWR